MEVHSLVDLARYIQRYLEPYKDTYTIQKYRERWRHKSTMTKIKNDTRRDEKEIEVSTSTYQSIQ